MAALQGFAMVRVVSMMTMLAEAMIAAGVVSTGSDNAFCP